MDLLLYLYIAYLKIVSQPKDDISLERIINVPKRSIGETTIKSIYESGSFSYFSQSIKLNNKSDWDIPDNIITKDICHNTCCLKTEWCDSYKEYFNKENIPIEYCSDSNPLFRFND